MVAPAYNLTAQPGATVLFAQNSPKTRQKEFAALSPAEQKVALDQMNLPEKEKLFSNLRSSYQALAAKGNDRVTQEKNVKSLLMVAASIIGANTGSRTTRDLICEILIFMKDNMKYDGESQRDKGKPAGGEILASGYCTACTDAAKLFITLFNAVAEQKPFFKAAKASYLESFNIDWAEKENWDSPSGLVAGHAMVRVDDNGRTTIVDSAMFRSFGDEENPVNPIFKRINADGIYLKLGDQDKPDRFKVFTPPYSIPSSIAEVRDATIKAARAYTRPH
jgi:hypothetical protein